MTLTKEHLIGISCMATAVVVHMLSRSFPKAATGANELTGPAFFPNILAVIIFICGLVELINGFRRSFESEELNLKNTGRILKQPETINVLLIIVLIVGYILFMEPLGFIPTTLIMLLTLMWRFRVPLFKNILYSIFFLVVLYLLFGQLFTIYLPSGIMEYVGL